MAGLAASLLGGAGFGLRYLGPSGEVRNDALGTGWRTRFETVSPVRRFPSHRGQRNFPGSWWSSTLSELVGFESWVERDQLMQLDFDRSVVGFASQPFWLTWWDGGRERRHAPDFFARLVDGTGVVIDVRPDQRIDEDDALAFALTRDACDAVGWEYRRVGVLDPVLAANLRWLAGYLSMGASPSGVQDRPRTCDGSSPGPAAGPQT
ncbi:TnsA-like heteromeric transposase endonuclease subunit [Streptosporangium canum]|uniref:TnsA-like heteromeric transposase endonuclease subunit n=1 Tax=Streptosporangium canum TaxID=324952 RepID=UPI0037AC4046